MIERSGPAGTQTLPPTAPPRTDGASPPRRSSGGGVILLPPWLRAPWRAFRHPAVLLAVIGAAAILTCASSSAALFLSSASSEALQEQAAAQCDDQIYPSVQVDGGGNTGVKLDATAQQAFAGNGLAAPNRTQWSDSNPRFVLGSEATGVRMWYQDGALDHVTKLAGGADPAARGVWLPQDTATRLSAKVGSEITMGQVRVPVVGIYRDLYKDPVAPFWCGSQQYFYNQGLENGPPPVALFTDPQTMSTALGSYDLSGLEPQWLHSVWSTPVDGAHLTVTDARRIVGQQNAAADALRAVFPTNGTFTSIDPNINLRDFAAQSTLIRDGMRGPVFPIALGGSLLALLLVGAAGSYWADRRFSEVRLLASRGVGPGGLALLAALELAAPAVIGAALGLGLAWVLVRGFGPAPELDSWAPKVAALLSAGALVAGIVLLSLVAGIRAKNTVEATIGARRSWAAKVPWELLVLAAAVLAYQRLRSGEAVIVDHNVAQMNLLLVAYPLLFLAGGAMLIVRLLTFLLPLLRRGSEGWTPALYLAARRVVSAPLVSATVLAAVSLPIGVLAYSGAITQTTSYTLHAKARVVVGGEASVSAVARPTDPAALDAVSTTVYRYERVLLNGGAPVTVLAIDPAGYQKYAFWDDRFAGKPLSGLLADLAGGSPAHPHVVSSELPTGTYSLKVGARTIAVDVVDTAAVVTGRHRPEPTILIDQKMLGETDRSAGFFAEFWTDDPDAVQRIMAAQHLSVFNTSSEAVVQDGANLLGVTWAFGYLEALAALVGLVAIGGLLLYLETRQRQRVAAYALSRRMGLSRRAHFFSLLAELATLIGLAFVVGAALAAVGVLSVYHRLELNTALPPPPLLSLPLIDMLYVGIASIVVAAGAAAYAHHAATRADTAEVMRLGA